MRSRVMSNDSGNCSVVCWNSVLDQSELAVEVNLLPFVKDWLVRS